MGTLNHALTNPQNNKYDAVWPSTLETIAECGLQIQEQINVSNTIDGAAAIVVKASEVISARDVAIKIYKDPSTIVTYRHGESVPMPKYFENERVMLACLDSCPFVSRYYYSVSDDDIQAAKRRPIQPFHVLEYVEGEKITKHSKSLFRVSDRIRLFQDVLELLDSIHEFGYLHRNLSEGSLLVDRHGRIRLIDIVEIPPFRIDQKRNVTGAGFQELRADSAEQNQLRKLRKGDVRDACTVGYAILTGSWKLPGESPDDWRQQLLHCMVPRAIADIVVTGMQEGSASAQSGQSDWQSVHEVQEAIAQVQKSRARNLAVLFGASGVLAIAGIVSMAGMLVQGRLAQIAYADERRRLNASKLLLSSKPEEVRDDPRVQRQYESSQQLERQADMEFRLGKNSESVKSLRLAEEEIHTAVSLVEHLLRLRPMLEPLKTILLENDYWNADSIVVRNRLERTSELYREICESIEEGNPEVAWQFVKQLHPELAKLIHDNARSLELSAIISHFDILSAGIDDGLRTTPEFYSLAKYRSNSELLHDEGRWSDAREQIVKGLANLQTFLDKNESPAQQHQRLLTTAKSVSTTVAAAESLQQQLQDLQEDIVKISNDDAILGNQSGSPSQNSKQTEGESQTGSNRHPSHFVNSKSNTDDLNHHIPVRERSAFIVAVEHILKHEVELSDGINHEVHQSIDTIKSLLMERDKYLTEGKTELHPIVTTLDKRVSHQLDRVIRRLKRRDAKYARHWRELRSKLNDLERNRDDSIRLGNSPASQEVRSISVEIDRLRDSMESFQTAKERHSRNRYAFEDFVVIDHLAATNLRKTLLQQSDVQAGNKIRNVLKMSFVFVPSGTFTMGSQVTEAGRAENEHPHEVTITHDFYIAESETTQEIYERVTGETPWRGMDYVVEGKDFPATYVSWDDVQQKFLVRLNQIARSQGELPEQWEYRLPTEAEWEYAARAGTSEPFSFGNEKADLNRYAWYEKNCWERGKRHPHPVGSKNPNRWGLYDVHGNVWEHVLDSYGSYPTGMSKDPLIENGTGVRVCRGGCFYYGAEFARSARRNGNHSHERHCNVGFRVVLSPKRPLPNSQVK
jgi:formylglycine-generating enzyme required for sulfatase activity/serine/threonine protein kinase